MPAAAMLAVLPSGRRALIQACAICGRQEATPITAGTAEHTPTDATVSATRQAL